VTEFEAGPDGIPIGRALIVSPGLIHDDLREAVRIVSRVHGDGVLPAIPLRMAQLDPVLDGERVRRGQFIWNEDSGQPIAILIEARFSHRVFATLHEIGHLLDLSGIGQGGSFAAQRAPEMADWRRALGRSGAISDLRAMGSRLAAGVDRLQIADLLDMSEGWARSYAQYVVNRSDSPSLRGSLDAFRRRILGKLYYPQQWDDNDFAEIDEAIETLFRRLGWRRELTP
jgi:hypothetical protein